MMDMRILLVEDDKAISVALSYSLAKEYEVDVSANKENALQMIAQNQYDLFLLDVTLPDGNGYDLCRYIKKYYDLPVIFLTAMDDEANIVMGLDIGADDYITKPFGILELQSRIRTIFRRYHKEIFSNEIKIQDITIKLKEGKVYKKQEEVLLTALEYRLLMVFVNHQGQILKRSQILEGIWDVAGNYVNDNTLSVYIKRLRIKLKDDVSEPKIITTIRGFGYRLEK